MATIRAVVVDPGATGCLAIGTVARDLLDRKFTGKAVLHFGAA